jgi:RNA-directed DNA polymerase
VAAPGRLPLALQGLERPRQEALPPVQGHTRTPVPGIRWAEDGLGTGRSTAFWAQEAPPLVAPLLAGRGLARAAAQPRGTPREDGGDWLGTQGRTYRGPRCGLPATKTVPAVRDPLRGIVKRHQPASPGHVSRHLTPVLRGGAQ